MSVDKHLAALPAVDSDRAAGANGLGDAVTSEIPDKLIKFNAREKKVWAHVTEALLLYGLVHKTDGLALTVICSTFASWWDVKEEFDKYKADNRGSIMVESGNGHCSIHPLFYAERELTKRLLVYLPEAALTIPSFQKARAAQPGDNQPGLFDDPVENFRAQKAAIGMRLVDKR